MKPFAILVGALLAFSACAASAEEVGVKPLFSYTGAFNAVVAGGRSKSGAYVHTLAAGLSAPLGEGWSVTGQGAATAGTDLSTRVIGDIAGVQGPFNSGNGLWLYELKLAYQGSAGDFQGGRLSTGDALPGVSGMDQFVNSAFSSNGGAITINDPGRATTPAATWGATGRLRAGRVELRAGAFLSDPTRTTLGKHGLDFTARTKDGVLTYAEAVTPVGAGLRAGLGAFSDSARFTPFNVTPVKGDAGYYAWIERPPPDKGPGVSGFLLAEDAPDERRNLEPVFWLGGLTWKGVNPRRPDDSVSLGATAGRFSHASPLRGWEELIEANYRFTLSPHLGVRPDAQWVLHPGGRGGGRDALVLGVQVEAAL